MAELPEELLAEVETLTRRARQAVDDGEATAYRRRRDELLAEHDFTARVREDDDDVLVCHPAEWVDDGAVHPDRVDDVDRAVEIPLEGPGDPDEWEAVAEHNRAVVQAVREDYGEVHGDNADAFAAFMSNHYAKPIESATPGEIDEFLEEFFVRNAWPSEEQAAVVEESVERVLEIAEE